MEFGDEQAKAVQETAKAVNKGLELAEKSGGFLERVFGGLIEDAIGVVADRVKYYRLQNLLEVQETTKLYLQRKGISVTRPIEPKFGLPLIEAATIESDPGIKDMYAALLANALDPSFRGDMRPAYVAIVKELSPLDAFLLKRLYEYKPYGRLQEVTLTDTSFRMHLGFLDKNGAAKVFNGDIATMIQGEEALSWLNLRRLGCVDLRQLNPLYSGKITPLGEALLRACSIE